MYDRYVRSGGAATRFDPLENTLEAHRRRARGRDEIAPVARHEEISRRDERHHELSRHDERPKKDGLGIGNLLKNFRIDWDTGDILLILIMILLYVDGEEDTELLLVLGLVLFLGI